MSSKLECALQTVGLELATLQPLDAKEQFARIRASFLRNALKLHPDKGGNADAFRELHDAFEYTKAATGAGAAPLDDAAPGAPPSQGGGYAGFSAQFYSQCNDGTTPPYVAEAAKSGRSTCIVCKAVIEQGALRFGSLDPISGSYGRFAHARCARIPSVVHAYLPPFQLDPEATKAALRAMDGLSLAGLAALSEEALDALVRAVSDTTRWAKTTKKKREEIAATKNEKKAKAAAAADVTSSPESTKSDASTTVVLAEAPSAAAVVSAAALVGKKCVLTGVFEATGGTGMAKGKGGLEALIAQAGGKTTGSVSKRTDFLVVGTLPGASKVSKAEALKVPMLTEKGLMALLAGEAEAPAAERVTETAHLTYSKGFGGNTVAPQLGLVS